jgi:hypothetical protein
MADLDDALTTLAAWLDNDGIPYMVIGGFAVTVWGEPRFTQDLNVTILAEPDELRNVIEKISSAFTPLVADGFKFVTETRVFPIMVNSVPAELIFAALPYEEEAIRRTRSITLKGGQVKICSPEDLILHKIVTPRARDREDVEGIFRYRHSELDYAYLDPRIEELATALADRSMQDWYLALRQRWKGNK